MEFINVDDGMPLDAATKRRVRSQAMKSFRQRQREKQVMVATQSRRSLHHEQNSLRLPSEYMNVTRTVQTENSQELDQRRQTQMHIRGLFGNPLRGDHMIGLCGKFYTFLQTSEIGAQTMNFLGQMWETSPKPRLFVSLALAACGTLEMLEPNLSYTLSLHYKARVLQGLRLQFSDPKPPTYDIVLPILVTLVDYEQSMISSEATFHLLALRKIYAWKLRRREFPECIHHFLVLELVDLALATWLGREPVIFQASDELFTSRASKVPSETTHDGPPNCPSPGLQLDCISTSLSHDVHVSRNSSLYGYTTTFKFIPRLFSHVQTYVRSAMAHGQVPNQSVFASDLDEFQQKIDSVYESLSRCDVALLNAYYSSLMILKSRINRQDQRLSDTLLQCCRSLTEVQFTEFPFICSFVLLTAGYRSEKPFDRRSCKVLLTKVFWHMTRRDWPRIQAFVIEYFQLICFLDDRKSKDQLCTLTPYTLRLSSSPPPPQDLGLVLNDPNTLARDRQDQRYPSGHNGRLTPTAHAVNRGLSPSQDVADQYFYLRTAKGGPWAALNREILEKYFIVS